MIRPLAVLMLSASAGFADQACMDRYFPVSVAQVTDSGRVEVGFRNQTPLPIIGYAITYVFETADGVFMEATPDFFLKNAVQSGQQAMHVVRIEDFASDLALTDVSAAAAHVTAAHQMVGVSDEGPTPLDIMLKECEQI